MKTLTGMSPADHKEIGHKLYILREQMILLVAPQFEYAKSRISRKMYGRQLTRQLNKVLYALDNVRDFLNTVAAHELPDNLNFFYYYPGSQDIEVPLQLAGIATERANRFHQNSMRRDLLVSDGQQPGVIDSEDGNTLFSFFYTGVRGTLAALSCNSELWPEKQKAKQLRTLCEKARSAAYALAVPLQELR